MLIQGDRCAARGLGEAKLQLAVRREHAFWDALDLACRQGIVPVESQRLRQGRISAGSNNSRASNNDGCSSAGVSHSGQDGHPGGPCKLFPRFADAASVTGDGGGELDTTAMEAGEGHGPRKEFFELAGADLARPQPSITSSAPRPAWTEDGPGFTLGSPTGALFVQLQSTGEAWFNAQLERSPGAARGYWFAGWLLAQALPNRAVLGLRLAPAVFEKLLGGAGYTVSRK